MSTFDRYMLKNLSFATLFVAATLSVIIILTQSLRFLELVIESGASSTLFWSLTVLVLPRFLEVILPISLMAGVLFVYSRMVSDSELVVMRASGASPMGLARPAIMLSLVITLFLMGVTMWAAPKSMRYMQEMRQEIKAQFSNVLFQAGVFNQVGEGLTIYVRDKSPSGELYGIMIHDSRDPSEAPATIVAKRGIMVSGDEGQEVVVFDGSRQQFNAKNQSLNQLNFKRYIVDLPESAPVRERWKESDERTVFELLNPDLSDVRDVDNLWKFKVEIYKRALSPFLAILFSVIACCCVLIGPFNRRGQAKRILLAVLIVTVIEGMYLALSSEAVKHPIAQVFVYLLVFGFMGLCLFLLSGLGEKFRRRALYKPEVVS